MTERINHRGDKVGRARARFCIEKQKNCNSEERERERDLQEFSSGATEEGGVDRCKTR